MPNLPDSLVRFYDDGPDWPRTPERQDAERAYRDAFLQSVREAARWTTIDHAAINAAWEERRLARHATAEAGTRRCRSIELRG